MRRHIMASLALAAITAILLLPAARASVVTEPAGIRSGGGFLSFCFASNDSAVVDGWRRINVTCPTTQTGITRIYPRDGNGSAQLTLESASGKADWSYERPRNDPFGKLSELTSLSYDWYRSSSSSNPASQHPVIRIVLDADGDPSTANDTQSLVFERVYNGAPIPVNSWQSNTIDDASRLWVTRPGTGGNENVFNWSLADFKSGNYVPTGTFRPITGDSLVLGITFGIGSGWNGAFDGAVDNVVLMMNGAVVLDANFEVPLFQVSVQCAPDTLMDAAGNVSTCTVSLDREAPSGGLTVALIPPADHLRYTSSCGTSIVIAAGTSSAQCTITAEPNTDSGDGDVTAVLGLAPPAADADYELVAPSSASVLIQDDDLHTVTLVCSPDTLTDSTGQVSTCTLSAGTPVAADDLAVAITPPASSTRYASDCNSPMIIAAGDSSATCTVTAVSNTVPGDGDVTATMGLVAPAAAAAYQLGAPNVASVLVRDDDVFTVGIDCTPDELADAPGQVSICTVGADAPAGAGGLAVLLTPPPGNARYDTSCTSPLIIAAGASNASCTIAATPNTDPDDGDVAVTVTLLPGAGYQLAARAEATVTVRDDDRAAAIPALGFWSLFMMALALVAAAAWRHARTADGH